MRYAARGAGGALCSTALAAAILTTSMAAVTTKAAHAAAPNPCSSRSHATLARRLGTSIQTALRGRTGTESVAVFDRRRGVSCLVNGNRPYDTASVVKVTVLGALMRRAAAEGRTLTARESSLARAMIARSDNKAASALWRELGRRHLQRFLTRAKMSQTRLGTGGYWGLTQTTARDQLRLLKALTSGNRVLTANAREYVLSLMAQVMPAQRWGVPSGAPTRTGVHLKNGWLPRHGRSWRVHSIGSFDGGGRDYLIVVLTQNAPSMTYAIRSIELVARSVHHQLNPGRRPMISESVPDATWELPDGSDLRYGRPERSSGIGGEPVRSGCA